MGFRGLKAFLRRNEVQRQTSLRALAQEVARREAGARGASPFIICDLRAIGRFLLDVGHLDIVRGGQWSAGMLCQGGVISEGIYF